MDLKVRYEYRLCIAETLILVLKALEHMQTSNEKAMKSFMSDKFKIITNGLNYIQLCVVKE